MSVLEKRIEEKNMLIVNFETEQRNLREENSKLRLNMYRFEQEKNDLEKRMNIMKDSQMSDSLKHSYDNNNRSSGGGDGESD